jgi:hypothetical protein
MARYRQIDTSQGANWGQGAAWGHVLHLTFFLPISRSPRCRLGSRLAFNLLLADLPLPKAFNARVDAIDRVGEFDAKETGNEWKLG